MKKLTALLIAMFMLFITGVHAQTMVPSTTSIEPYRIEVTTTKTTNIVFPHAIISVDRGSKDILAQKATGVENILQLKAARDSFAETNISVVTADGKLNSFIVNYAKLPKGLNISLVPGKTAGTISLSSDQINAVEIQDGVSKAAYYKPKNYRIKDDNHGLNIKVTGLFIRDNAWYVKLQLHNSSNINYDVEQFRFFIKDEKKVRRTAYQEIEVSPIYITGNADGVAANTIKNIIVVLPKFTIPDKKYLSFQMMEKGGGRHLILKIKNKHLFDATLMK